MTRQPAENQNHPAGNTNRNRNVKLRLGKMTYNILTPLSNATIARVQEILDLVSHQTSGPGRIIGQEDMLLLACLHLAYALDTTSERLSEIIQRIEQGTTDLVTSG